MPIVLHRTVFEKFLRFLACRLYHQCAQIEQIVSELTLTSVRDHVASKDGDAV